MDLKELEKKFVDEFGTGVDMDGCMIEGNNSGSPMDYHDLWDFIEQAVLEERKRIVEIIKEVDEVENVTTNKGNVFYIGDFKLIRKYDVLQKLK